MTDTTKTGLSQHEFANLGAPTVVYIRPVIAPDGSKTFSLHAANGQKLADLPSFEEAVLTAHSNDFHPVSVH